MTILSVPVTLGCPHNTLFHLPCNRATSKEGPQLGSDARWIAVVELENIHKCRGFFAKMLLLSILEHIFCPPSLLILSLAFRFMVSVILFCSLHQTGSDTSWHPYFRGFNYGNMKRKESNCLKTGSLKYVAVMRFAIRLTSETSSRIITECIFQISVLSTFSYLN